MHTARTPLTVSRSYATDSTRSLYENAFKLMELYGWRPSTRLLTVDANPKTAKNAKVGDYTAILHLLPHTLSGRNVCPWASKGCAAACLHTAGNSQYMPAKTRARRARTELFFADRTLFLELLDREIAKHTARAHRLHLNPSVRLNGTSDIAWESVARHLFLKHERTPDGNKNGGDVVFYDYTKSPFRALAQPYHLTFSRSECNDDDCRRVLSCGGTVAVVVEGYGISAHPKPLPEYTAYFGTSYPVIDGDVHDARYMDAPGSVIALRAKGDAIGDTSGFVIPRSQFK